MRIAKPLVLGAMCLGLAGCGMFGDNGPLGIGRMFGDGGAADAGLPFRAKLSRGQDRRNFTVTVRAGGATVPQARESARFPATRYCIETYGASDIDWVIDPASGDWAVSRDSDKMVFAGRCTAR